VAKERWLALAFPNSWHYDVGRVLDYFRLARPAPDDRMGEALGMLESKRGADGRWMLEHAHHTTLLVDLGETVGRPSRWLTLRALRVLRWAGATS
jgi:hypothetical protein